MVHKLLSYSQHNCDFARGLPLARSLREQIDWKRVQRDTAHSPYAEVFLILLDRLDVVPLRESEADNDSGGREVGGREPGGREVAGRQPIKG